MNGYESWRSDKKHPMTGKKLIAWKVKDRDGVEVYGMANSESQAYKDAQKAAGKSH